MNSSTSWGAKRWTARLLRWAYVLVPLSASVATSAVASRLLPREQLGTVGLVLIVLALSTVALIAVHQLTRRVLPLAALLEISVQFPGEAPSRFAVARDAGNPEHLRRIVERAQADDGTPRPTRSGTDPVAAREILALVAALRSHDRRTRGHSERVRVFTDLVADELALSADDRERLRWAALLHDVGKLTVDAEILNKPSKLAPREWDAVRAHPAAGERLIAPLADWLGPWAAAVSQHHERWDGSGYPAGLAGEDISLAGRVVAVSDSFETMTAARSYKRAMSREDALRELTGCAGTHFDPRVVRAFLTVGAPRLRWAMGPLSWVASWPVVAAAPAPATVFVQAGAGALALGATTVGVVVPSIGLGAPVDVVASASAETAGAVTASPVDAASPVAGGFTVPEDTSGPVAAPDALPPPVVEAVNASVAAESARAAEAAAAAARAAVVGGPGVTGTASTGSGSTGTASGSSSSGAASSGAASSGTASSGTASSGTASSGATSSGATSPAAAPGAGSGSTASTPAGSSGGGSGPSGSDGDKKDKDKKDKDKDKSGHDDDEDDEDEDD